MAGIRRTALGQLFGYRTACIAVALAVWLGCGAEAWGDPDPCELRGTQVPLVPSNASCELMQTVVRPTQPGEAFEWSPAPLEPTAFPANSCCWGTMPAAYLAQHAHGPVSLTRTTPDPAWDGAVLPAGFRLNVNLLATPSIGDFLPPAPTLGRSSIVLLPPGEEMTPIGWHGADRPVLDDTVDLITGLPLISATDLTLPFGSATFRLTRTRSGSHPLEHEFGSNYRIAAQDRFWNWAGEGWMIGENPFLLIDSAVPDLVGPHPRTIWLVLDAHHSIPFQQVMLAGGRVGYEAPPRFRARLRHNGTWTPGAGWENVEAAPTQYEIWLYDGAIKYTFVAVREDVPPSEYFDPQLQEYVTRSYHDLATYPSDLEPSHSPWTGNNPGLGIPYYGLCTRIEDRYGNRVDIHYCSVERDSVDDPETENCHECAQRCARKGQISHVELSSGGAVEWTLVYVHRYFEPQETGWTPFLWLPDPQAFDYGPYFGAAAIDRIAVFNGPLQGVGCYEFGSDEPYPTTVDPVSGAGFPDWVHRIDYQYRTRDRTWEQDPDRMRFPPTLLRSSVSSRRQDSNGHGEPDTETVRDTFYRYTENGDGEQERQAWLERIYTSDDFGRMLEWARSPAPKSGAKEVLADWLIEVDESNDPAQRFAAAGYPYWHESASEEEVESGKDPGFLELLHGFASFRLAPPDGLISQDATPSAPSMNHVIQDHNGKPGYVALDAETLAVDGGMHGSDNFVGTLSLRLESDEERHYRIHRLVVLPRAESPSGGGPIHVGIPHTLLPDRSIFVQPFRWNTSKVEGDPAQLAADLNDVPDLQKERWVTIIDEFSDRARMMTISYEFPYDGLYGIKEGQLSRRVVMMNAAGYVLSDRLWEFRNGEAFVSGGGLGERYVYMPIKDVLPNAKTELMEEVEGDDPSNPTDPEAKERQIAGVLNELLLVERRSVGWSAVEGTEDEASEGLIRFYEYEWFPNGSNEPPVPWRDRAQLVAEGVRRGTEGVDLYTREIFRDPDKPNDLLGELRYLTTSFAQSRFGTLPTLNETDYPHFSLTQTVVERREPTVEPGEDEPPVTEWPVARVQQIGPPRQLQPGSGWYFPIEVQFNDEEGLPHWSVQGLVQDLGDPGQCNASLSTRIFTYMHFDNGRLEYRVVDVDPVTTSVMSPHPVNPFSLEVTNPPDGWSRKTPEGGFVEPLEYVTYHEYQGSELSDIYFHTGRRWARRATVIVATDKGEPLEQYDAWEEPDRPRFIREYIFNDLEWDEQDNVWRARSVGEVLDYPGMEPWKRPVVRRRVEFVEEYAGEFIDAEIKEDVLGPVFGANDQPWFRPVAKVELWPDHYGKLSNAEIFERDVFGQLNPVGFRYINELGEMYREVEMDGTITRITRNSLGQNLRRYVGTVDDEWVEPQNPGHMPPGETNNLVLVERTEYGNGSSDAWLPTIVRRYNTNEEFPDQWHEYPHDNDKVPENDAHGQATRTHYDWRMRPVRVDVFATGDPNNGATRLTTTLTILDHGGRTRLTVTYGPDVPGSELELPDALDPSQFAWNTEVPSAGAYLINEGLAPISLVEMVYSPDGTMMRRYDYDTSDLTGDPDYHAAHEYQGFGGQTAFNQGVGAGVQVSFVDGVGRVARTATVVPRIIEGEADYGFEIARTDYEYDGDGNPIKVHRWERVVDAMGVPPSSKDPQVDVLDFHNAVRSTTLNWYDVNRRLVASAELGTERSDGLFTSDGTDPSNHGWYNPTNRPEIWPFDTVPWVDRAGVSEDVPLTVYKYDRDGNQTFVATRPGGNASDPYQVTRFEYTGLRNVAWKTENYFDDDNRRTTEYRYRFGRLKEIIADWHQQPASTTQQTALDFGFSLLPGQELAGAEVVDMGRPASEDRVISRHGSHVRSMHMPGPGGSASASASHFLRYDFHGRLVERIDGRGIAIRYEHDDLGRLTSVEIGYYDGSSFVSGYPTSLNFPGHGSPSDRIGFIEYEYDADMKGFEATAYTARSGGVLVSQNRFKFDGRGNLTHDWQSLGAEIDEESPHTLYTWDMAWCDDGEGAGPAVLGHRRLASMRYPAPWFMDEEEARWLLFEYGSPGSADDVYSRLRAIVTEVDTQDDVVAQFGYVGQGRRAWMSLGDDVLLQSFGLSEDLLQDPIGLHGVDRYGRTVDMHWRHGTLSDPGASIARLQYAYDLMGNRIESVRTPRLMAVQTDERQEQENQYDAFNRLTAWLAEDVNGQGQPLFLHRQDAWTLDLLGNWGERQTTVGTEPQTWVRHITDSRNRITALETPGEEEPESMPVLHDAAGNLLFCGEFAYQYDAWNRLVQVSQAEHIEDEYIEVGVMVKHYTYDAVGRLVRTQSPHPEPDPNAPDAALRSERFYYDGIRRIQELTIDPMESLLSAQSSPEMSALAAATVGPSANELDGQSTPAVFEAAQLDDDPEPKPPLHNPRIDREYVWGPGGVDELLVQFDPWREMMPVIQDAGGDAIALCDLNGSGGAARVVAQFTYDPYGQVIAHEHLHTHAWLRAGHKGLFVDRLDAGVANSAGDDLPRLVAGARLQYYMRNRTLDARLGRALQMDPNASGLVVIEAEYQGGRALQARVALFDLAYQHTDGPNLYLHLRGAPGNGSDPLGLFMGPFDTMVVGLTIGASLNRALQFYADDQMAMAMWALDWSLPDDLFDQDSLDLDLPFFDPFGRLGDQFLASANVLRGVTGVKGVLGAMRGLTWKFGEVFDSYSAARAAKAGAGLGQRAQAHHLVPRSFAKLMEVSTNGPAVILGKKHHQVFTTRLNRELGNLKRLVDQRARTGNPMSVTERREAGKQALLRVYDGVQPEWAARVLDFIP